MPICAREKTVCAREKTVFARVETACAQEGTGVGLETGDRALEPGKFSHRVISGAGPELAVSVGEVGLDGTHRHRKAFRHLRGRVGAAKKG